MAQANPPPGLGYAFNDPSLLDRALTHRSADGPHNERLEFLGDAVLSFIVAEELYRRFPQAREGELTRLRARVVRSSSLAAIARSLDLGRDLRLGGGELKSGGRERDSILADALEAIVGAVFLDGGIERCRTWVLGLFDEVLGALEPGEQLKDPKTRLQEWLQGRRLPLPSYSVVAVTGDEHDQHFTVACEVRGLAQTTRGEGSSRRVAEQAAAACFLATLAEQPDTPSSRAGRGRGRATASPPARTRP
jgi:ribonuclease-3